MGMDYGITNKVGNRGDSYWFDFLDYVFEQGVYKLDTAPAYQDSERRIGQWLQGDAMARKKVKITTKFPPISADEAHDERDLISILVSSLRDSHKRLAHAEIDTVMFHRADILQVFPDCIWEIAEILDKEGFCQNLGVSVQSPDELQAALDCDAIVSIQMPYNLIDTRWENLIPQIKMQKKVRRLHIVGRSVFLQGLLLSQDEDIWRCANVQTPHLLLSWLQELSEYYVMSPLQVALNFVYQQEWIDTLVLGASKQSEFSEICYAVCGSKIPREDLSAIANQRPFVELATVNPSRWNYV